MKLADFNFDLPSELIARFPADCRDGSKLMVVNRENGEISHFYFSAFPELLNADDFLVMNNSRVLPARLLGKIGSKTAELLIVKKIASRRLEVLCQPSAAFEIGTVFCGQDGLQAEVVEIGKRGRRLIACDRDYEQVLEQGYAPLPPYIKRKGQQAGVYRSYDLERYQTVYAKNYGSIAAPTAGLHFTPQLLTCIRSRNQVLEITLDVGEATFQKILSENLSEHRMGSEKIIINHEVASHIRELKSRKKKLLAIGTTTVRSLESYALLQVATEEFYSDIFISPGFYFNMVDKMLTNFHLPQSSLFILVSAFAGLDLMKKAYALAIDLRYRFYSYGDAMLII